MLRELWRTRLRVYAMKNLGKALPEFVAQPIVLALSREGAAQRRPGYQTE
jgi:hypothetical protein